MAETGEKPYYGRDRRDSRERRGRAADHRRASALLPHPSILERYEEVTPGSGGRIIHMAEKEMEHRHAWENNYRQEYMRLYKLGQAFGLVISLATIFSTLYLFLEQEFRAAVIVAVGGFFPLVVASVASAFSGRRRFGR